MSVTILKQASAQSMRPSRKRRNMTQPSTGWMWKTWWGNNPTNRFENTEVQTPTPLLQWKNFGLSRSMKYFLRTFCKVHWQVQPKNSQWYFKATQVQRRKSELTIESIGQKFRPKKNHRCILRFFKVNCWLIHIFHDQKWMPNTKWIKMGYP